MMKMKRIFASMAAAVMAVTALPVFSAGANEGTYSMGDVDMDGVVTGHDTALLSRFLFTDTITLNNAQKFLADMNQDGVLDTSDTELIHSNEVYPIGYLVDFADDFQTCRPTRVSRFATIYALDLYGYKSLGLPISITESSADLDGTQALTLERIYKEGYQKGRKLSASNEKAVALSQLQFNLLDIDADGDVDMTDAYSFFLNNSYQSIGFPSDMCFVGDGCYLPRYTNEICTAYSAKPVQ